MSVDIVVCGHLTLDMIPNIQMLTPDNLADAGKLFEIGTMAMSTGGAVSNTGLALHKLGIDVGLMGLVGDDWIGNVIRDFLQQQDPSLTDHIQIISSASSAYTIVVEPQNHDRTLLTHTGTNPLFSLDTLDLEVIQQAKIFHLGYPTLLPRLYQNDGDELLRIFQTVKQASSCITSLDMTLPDANHASGQANWEMILSRVLPYVDIFLPSIDEIMFMLRFDDYQKWHGHILANITDDYLIQLADDLLNMGSAIIGFKLGKQGFYIKTASDSSRLSCLAQVGQTTQKWVNKIIRQSTFNVDVMGTTGAGDAAYAGFLCALIRGLQPEQCLQIACAVGACAVEQADPTSGILSWDATLTRIASGWVQSS